ncbi:hypothetical protein GCM10011608_36880 [Micromonospora sonchi]|uniref:Tetratricopeptide repeat protein n=1 Tax=Micromonospora sonchi TaxID=1763543 RepID=A0A917X0G5_9ACTN|nr:hypothetical protein GCM10011608_36880 [Micromonospora sonchi]
MVEHPAIRTGILAREKAAPYHWFMFTWYEAARIAEERGDWNRAVSEVSAVAECYSSDHVRHNAHLWHMDLLVRAGRHDELAALSENDVHARRRLNRLPQKLSE